MYQQEINQSEWFKQENWLNPNFLGIYASKQDSRLIVPKRIPAMGWTVNFGHKYGSLLVFGALAVAASVAIAAWRFARRK